MFKTFLLSLFLLIAPAAKAEVWTVNQILEATCRVDAGGAFGTGTCMYFENNQYYVSTNAHVVGGASTVKVEFFKEGRKTLPLPAKVVFRRLDEGTECDFAILTIDARYFGKFPPRIAKMAPNNAEPLGQYVVSAGCPGARWPSGWEGLILQKSAGRLLFYPPPIGGQSGSGLYVVINNNGVMETVLYGTVTWRIGGGTNLGNENQGYESNYGGAVLMSRLKEALAGKVSTEKIPNNYIPVATCPVSRQYWKGEYAYGSDNRYYKIQYDVSRGEYFTLNPPNVNIISWGVQFCEPGGSCGPPENGNPGLLQPIPPQNNPVDPDNTNPYNNLPNFDQPAPNTPVEPEVPQIDYQGEINKLTVENSELKKQIIILTNDLNTKNAEAAGLSTKIGQLEVQYKELQATETTAKEQLLVQINSLKTELSNQVNSISEVTQKLHDTNEVLKTITDENEALKNTTKTHEDVVEELVEEKEEVADTSKLYGWLSTILGTGFVGTVIAWVLKSFMGTNKFGQRVEDKLDPLEDKIQQRIESVLGPVIAQQARDKLEAEQAKAIDLVDKKLRDFLEEFQKKNDIKTVTIDKFDDRIAGLAVDNQVANETVLNKIAELGEVITNTPSPQPQTTTVNNNVNVEVTPTYDKNSINMRHFRELLRIKQRDGQNPEQFAFFSTLYKEAVEELKKGNLYYKGQSPLLGSQATAEKIQEWVNEQFIKRHGTEAKVSGDVELDALLGFLYKEAIDLLRTGNMNTLNAEDTAKEIDKWVNREYARRLGIQ